MTTRLLVVGGAALAIALTLEQLAVGAPGNKSFGPGIDDAASYEGQSTCSPSPKPGVVAFQSIVFARHPATGSFGISRACDVGGRSEHKEGRAWDWEVYHSSPTGRAAAADVIDWLLDRDRFGNSLARARRFGIMYMIWNKRIWNPYDGWRTYCTMRNGVCYGSDGNARSPHTNHVHFSFTWPGARRQTTWWRRSRSMVDGIMPASNGYWVVARNGSVLTHGAPFLGSRSDRPLRHRVVGGAVTPSRSGYWLLAGNGAVSAFGDAPDRGGAKSHAISAVAMASTPTGRGYWILARDGRVLPYGDASDLGDKRASRSRWTSIASTSTGLGYRLFASGGGVAAFGDASHHGDARDRRLGSPVATGVAYGDDGYWLVTKEGRVLEFGNAPSFDGVKVGGLNSPVVDAAAATGRDGMWLATKRGRVYARGDAPMPAARISTTSAATTGRAQTYPRLDTFVGE